MWPDLDAARRMAIRYAGALPEESGHRLQFGETWHPEATDEARRVPVELDFRISAAV